MALKTPQEYLESLRKLNLEVYLFGERVKDPVDNPIIRPSLNSVIMTYELAQDPKYADLMVVESHMTGEKINRFTHIHQSTDDLVKKVKMQRLLGQKTAACFQRCVGMDAFNAVYSTTYETDQKYGTEYHARFKKFLEYVQREDLTVDGAMTDPKGDRGLSPSKQEDPDLFLHIVEKRADGIVVKGAKVHQTGIVNSHEVLVMPTISMTEEDKDYAVAFSVPTDTKGIKIIYGRQSCDTRKLEEGTLDRGNPKFGGHEALVIFDDVFVPTERIFMCEEYDFSGMLVERFAIIEMIHLNETLYCAGIACSSEGHPTVAGSYEIDMLLANICKQNVTRFPYEIARLAEDIAGGLFVTMPSEKDYRDPVLGGYIDKYLKGVAAVPTIDRMKVLRLIENLTLGTAAVGYRTESMHGAGSPQAQRIMISRQSNLEVKKQLVKDILDIKD